MISGQFRHLPVADDEKGGSRMSDDGVEWSTNQVLIGGSGRHSGYRQVSVRCDLED